MNCTEKPNLLLSELVFFVFFYYFSTPLSCHDRVVSGIHQNAVAEARQELIIFRNLPAPSSTDPVCAFHRGD